MSTRKRNRASAAAADDQFAATNGGGGEDASMNEMPPRKKSRKENRELAKRLAQEAFEREAAAAAAAAAATPSPLAPAAVATSSRRAKSLATAQRMAQEALAIEAASPPATPPAAAAAPPSVAAVATTAYSATKKPTASSTSRKSRQKPEEPKLSAQMEQPDRHRQMQDQQYLQAALDNERKRSPTAAAGARATASRPSVARPTAATATPPHPAATVPKTSFQSPAKPAAAWRPSLPPTAAAHPNASPSHSKTVSAPTREAVAAASATVRSAAPVALPVDYRHNGNSNNHATRSPRDANSDDEDDDALLHRPYYPTSKDDSPQVVDEKVENAGSSDGLNGFVDADQGLTEPTKMPGRFGTYAVLIAVMISVVAAICVAHMPPPSREGPTLLQLTSSSTTGSPTTKAHKSTLAPDSRPCFETYPPRSMEDDPQDASAVLEYWAPHCSREYYLQEPFSPCPPHATCEGGKIVACDSYFWVPKQIPRVSASTSKEPTTNDDVDWPTECVLSEQAEVFLSSVTNILEGWYVSSSCSRGSSLTTSSKPPVMRSADGTVYPLVSYNDVLSDLDRQGHDQQLQDMLFPDADLFQELAEGRLAMSSTTDEATSTSTLWIGLLPKHTDPRPSSCQTASRIVAVLHLVWNCLLGALRAVINGLLLPVVSFVWNVVWNVYFLSPMVSIGATLVLVVYMAYLRPRWARRRAELQWIDQLDSIHRAAIHLLRKETGPLAVLALRDAIREQQQRNGQGLTSIAFFNEVVWPEVQARLEADQRIGLVVRHNQNAMKWEGPKSH